MFPRLTKKKIKQWPTKYQWLQFFKILSKKEKILFLAFLILFISSGVFLLSNLYIKSTKIVPTQGGAHIEGVIGRPRFINPIYANSDIDRDLVELIFSGLMKYDQDMNIVPDLAQDYQVEENGKVYKFFLKENIFWQDKTPLTSDDIVFTIKTIQNPDYKSPLRANWVGVKVEAIGEFAVKFELKKPYSAFLENSTVKILPKHIWQNISPENFAFDLHNLAPVGSGPYKLKKLKQEKTEPIKDLTLIRNPFYFDKKPNISEIKFLFFDNENDLIKAAKKGKITGFSHSLSLSTNQKWQNYSISLPRYFGVFFNPNKSEILSDKNVRLALNYGTDKKELVRKLRLPENSIVHSPILPKIYGFESPAEIYNFSLEKAKEILDKAEFKETENGLREKIIKKEPAFQFKRRLSKGSKGEEVKELQKCLAKFSDIYPNGEITGYFGPKTKIAVISFQEKYREDILEPWGFKKGTGIVSKTTRAKLNEVCFETSEKILPLKISLATVDQPQLNEAAEELKRQWKLLGLELEIQKVPIFQLEQNFIKPRAYQALLFGEVLGAIPDPLPFWHSSQKIDPGLNLAIYQNKKVDQLLEEIRKSPEAEFRAEKLALVQDIIIKDAPALFLYSPDLIYSVSKKIKGVEIKKIVDPSKRFAKIEDWYIKTKRIWK